MNWYPKRDTEWYPDRPTVWQVGFGAVLFVALAGLALYWAAGESSTGNRIFLWVMAGLALVLATWRIAIGVRLAREGRRRRRNVRGLKHFRSRACLTGARTSAVQLRHYLRQKRASVTGAWGQTEAMTEVRPASDLDPAQWLLRSDVDWWDLVRYGPPGFDVYARIAFAQDPDGVAGEDHCLRRALATLADYTTTPASAYAAIWEGWGGDPPPEAPRVSIPHRAMLLFTGPVRLLRDAPALAWYGSAQGYQEPHLVWPEDQAWCLACEVDEEVEFTVGCSVDASRALARALPGAFRLSQYGDPAPLHRDLA